MSDSPSASTRQVIAALAAPPRVEALGPIAGRFVHALRLIALHERLGFARCGEIRHAGFKFGRWLDLVFYQRVLKGPERPVDG
jgi:L-amino acid N-acyltransferase YncA